MDSDERIYTHPRRKLLPRVNDAWIIDGFSSSSRTLLHKIISKKEEEEEFISMSNGIGIKLNREEDEKEEINFSMTFAVYIMK